MENPEPRGDDDNDGRIDAPLEIIVREGDEHGGDDQGEEPEQEEEDVVETIIGTIASFDGTFFISQQMVGYVRNLSQDQLDRVAEGLEERVNEFEIIYSGPDDEDFDENERIPEDEWEEACRETAEKAAYILVHLDSLRRFGVEWNAEYTDYFLKEMITKSTAKLETFRLTALGKNGKIWKQFLDRFGSSIQTLTFDALAGMDTSFLALGLCRKRLPSLHHLDVSLSIQDDHDSSNLSLFCRGLPLKSLDVSFICKDFSTDSFSSLALGYALKDLVTVVSQHKTLSTLRVFNCPKEHDSSVLLKHLLLAPTLEKITFYEMAFSFDQENSFDVTHLPPKSYTNRLVKEIRFEQCTMGEGCFRLLSRFQGLQTLNNESCDIKYSPRAFSMMLEHLQNLESFQDNYIGQNLKLSSIASGLQTSSSLQNLELSNLRYQWNGPEVTILPALKEVVRNCNGTLFLKYVGTSDLNVKFLCEGMEETQSLTTFKLQWSNKPLTQSSILKMLKSLSRNRSIQSFSATFKLADGPLDSEVFGNALVELITSNTTLASFGFDLVDKMNPQRTFGQRWFPEDAVVVSNIVAGLHYNRYLQAVAFRFQPNEIGYLLADSSISSQILNMLQFNTTLTTIRGLRYQSLSDKERIEWLLTLNLYKRQFLVDSKQVPIGWWAHVLARIGVDGRQDVMFHFIKNLPGEVWRKRRGVKRRSGEHEV